MTAPTLLFSLLYFVMTVGLSEHGFCQNYEVKTILIDPGHGGVKPMGSDKNKSLSSDNNGVSSKQRLLEKNLTLDLSLLIAQRLRNSPEARGGKLHVELTRETGINLDFVQRARKAAAVNASCFISIHFNTSEGSSASGPRAIIQNRSKNPNESVDKSFGLALASAVARVSKRFRPATPNATWHDDHELHAGEGSYLFYQLNQFPETRLIPSCHLEVEFMDNRDVERLLLGASRDEVFAAWADAIASELIQQVMARH
jgi:N-acetylmuramoyl-L-alanine amidase